jgi:hypothetical protein
VSEQRKRMGCYGTSVRFLFAKSAAAVRRCIDSHAAEK